MTRRLANAGLWVVQGFNLVSALGGGVALVVTGGLGMPVSLLDASPFDSYLLPGLILVLVVGGTQALALWTHYRRSRWAHLAAAVAGFGLIIWIHVEMTIVHDFAWLQTVYFVTGTLQLVLVMALLGVLPQGAGVERRATR